jgi:hypothetical protein
VKSFSVQRFVCSSESQPPLSPTFALSALKCKQVAALIASHNEIELLPQNMHLSYHLADVQLHCNHLVALDPSLFAATSITSLRLDSNLITNLPDDVASASSLQVTLSSCVSNKILYCSGHHSRLNLTPVAPAAGAEHFIQPVAAAAYSSVRPHLIANPDVPRLPLGFIHLAPKGKFRFRIAVHWAPILVTV